MEAELLESFSMYELENQNDLVSNVKDLSYFQEFSNQNKRDTSIQQHQSRFTDNHNITKNTDQSYVIQQQTSQQSQQRKRKNPSKELRAKVLSTSQNRLLNSSQETHLRSKSLANNQQFQLIKHKQQNCHNKENDYELQIENVKHQRLDDSFKSPDPHNKHSGNLKHFESSNFADSVIKQTQQQNQIYLNPQQQQQIYQNYVDKQKLRQQSQSSQQSDSQRPFNEIQNISNNQIFVDNSAVKSSIKDYQSILNDMNQAQSQVYVKQRDNQQPSQLKSQLRFKNEKRRSSIDKENQKSISIVQDGESKGNLSNQTGIPQPKNVSLAQKLSKIAREQQKQSVNNKNQFQLLSPQQNQDLQKQINENKQNKLESQRANINSGTKISTNAKRSKIDSRSSIMQEMDFLQDSQNQKQSQKSKINKRISIQLKENDKSLSPTPRSGQVSHRSKNGNNQSKNINAKESKQKASKNQTQSKEDQVSRSKLYDNLLELMQKNLNQNKINPNQAKDKIKQKLQEKYHKSKSAHKFYNEQSLFQQSLLLSSQFNNNIETSLTKSSINHNNKSSITHNYMQQSTSNHQDSLFQSSLIMRPQSSINNYELTEFKETEEDKILKQRLMQVHHDSQQISQRRKSSKNSKSTSSRETKNSNQNSKVSQRMSQGQLSNRSVNKSVQESNRKKLVKVKVNNQLVDLKQLIKICNQHSGQCDIFEQLINLQNNSQVNDSVQVHNESLIENPLKQSCSTNYSLLPPKQSHKRQKSAGQAKQSTINSKLLKLSERDRIIQMANQINQKQSHSTSLHSKSQSTVSGGTQAATNRTSTGSQNQQKQYFYNMQERQQQTLQQQQFVVNQKYL